MGRPSSAVEESNLDHLDHYMRHQNAQQLGRDQPFALWAKHNGRGGGWDLFWDGF